MKRMNLLMLGLFLGGCSGGFGELPQGLCQQEHVGKTSDGEEVVVCDRLYAEAPYIHLPKAESDHAFAGIEGRAFVTESGAAFTVPDEDAETKRHAVTLYELLLDDRSVEEYRPVLELKPAAFLSAFVGRAAEGTIARRTSADRYAVEASLPVRLQFGSELVADASAEGGFEVGATIANLSEPMTASDGTCMPALSSYGDESTFPSEAAPEYRGSRVTSMHHFGDDQFVMRLLVDGEERGTTMAPTWYLSPLDLARGKSAPSRAYDGTPHGSPDAIPAIDLSLVEGGGTPCEP